MYFFLFYCSSSRCGVSFHGLLHLMWKFHFAVFHGLQISLSFIISRYFYQSVICNSRDMIIPCSAFMSYGYCEIYNFTFLSCIFVSNFMAYCFTNYSPEDDHLSCAKKWFYSTRIACVSAFLIQYWSNHCFMYFNFVVHIQSSILPCYITSCWVPRQSSSYHCMLFDLFMVATEIPVNICNSSRVRS